MKPKMTPEEATESFRIFLEQHDKRFEHLLALGTILEDVRITDLSKRQEKGEYTYIFHKEEIELTLNQRKVCLFNSTGLEKGQPRKSALTMLCLKDVSLGSNTSPKEQLFTYSRLAEVLAISKEEAAFLTMLLLEEFNAFHQFFGVGKQKPLHFIDSL